MNNLEHSDEIDFGDHLKSAAEDSRSNDLLQVPSGYFESQQALLESALHAPTEVPAGYFESQAAVLEERMNATQLIDGKGRMVRMWMALAAAVVIGVMYIVYWPSDKNERTFADQLEEANLDYDDLHEIEFDETVYEEFIVDDTIVTDTIAIQKTPIEVHDFKPSKGQRVITWDDIDDEDIREYLKDEEQLNIIDDL
jgi:hypothetical protein